MPSTSAGLGRGDVVVSLAGTAVVKPGDWERVVAALTPGSEVALVFESRGERKTRQLMVGKGDRLEVVPTPDRTPQQEALRAGWLGSKTAG